MLNTEWRTEHNIFIHKVYTARKLDSLVTYVGNGAKYEYFNLQIVPAQKNSLSGDRLKMTAHT